MNPLRWLAASRSNRRLTRLAEERGQALLETAITLPMVLLVAVSIFEFGRAYQVYQVVTNAAREGARVAVLPNTTVDEVKARVNAYLQNGQIGNPGSASIAVNQTATVSIGATTASASVVTVSYPLSFMVMNPVVRLVTPKSTLGAAPITLTASAQMRNEAQ